MNKDKRLYICLVYIIKNIDSFTYLRYRIMKPAKDYSTTRFIFWILSWIIFLWPIIYILANEYEKCMYWDKQEIACTPSQDTQQILQAISWSQLSIEYLVTELPLQCE